MVEYLGVPFGDETDTWQEQGKGFAASPPAVPLHPAEFPNASPSLSSLDKNTCSLLTRVPMLKPPVAEQVKVARVLKWVILRHLINFYLWEITPEPNNCR